MTDQIKAQDIVTIAGGTAQFEVTRIEGDSARVWPLGEVDESVGTWVRTGLLRRVPGVRKPNASELAAFQEVERECAPDREDDTTKALRLAWRAVRNDATGSVTDWRNTGRAADYADTKAPKPSREWYVAAILFYLDFDLSPRDLAPIVAAAEPFAAAPEWERDLINAATSSPNPHYHCSSGSYKACPTGEHVNPHPEHERALCTCGASHREPRQRPHDSNCRVHTRKHEDDAP